MNRSLLMLSCLLGLTACAEDNETHLDAEATAMDAAPDAAPDAAVDAAPPVDPLTRWHDVEPGGDTICSRGTPYRFFVRDGDPDKVIFDFQGGGACWDETSCSVAGALFAEEARPLSAYTDRLAEGTIGGLFDADPALNPLADWTLVHVQYCTGDIHWGNAEKTYREGLTIEHRGFVNASATLAWAYERFNPSQILVSGCSAGAYGAILHSAYIARQYPDARLAVLADSGAGIITDSFLADSLPNWGAQPNLPDFVAGLDRPITELTLPAVYIGVAGTFPQHRFAQTATAFDADQIFYYTAMGGAAGDWPGRFRDSLATIAGSAPNFTYYVPPGPMHCALPYPFLADREVNGVRQIDWVDDLVNAPEMPAPVACEGEACFDDPVCDACAANGGGPGCGFCDGWPDQFRNPQ
ncbi:MAG: pectinesterase [Myxococcales bacterium]|nr:pectinesterase [Myxococcales bacterium]